MTLNTAQYIAPLNSQQVLSGYVQGVKQGVGVSIAADGTITLDGTGASSLGFLVSSSAPAPVYNWTMAPGTSRSILVNDGLANVTWTEGYIATSPIESTFPHAGAAIMPVGGTGSRPASQEGLLRYNSDFDRLEFNNGTVWIPVSPASGGVFSFTGAAAPAANAVGDLWLDTNTNQEKVWDGVSWVPTTPLATAIVPGRVKIGVNVQIAPDGTISILPTTGVSGSVSNLGLTTITDNVSSLSIDSALSANQGRLLQQQINALVISNNLTLAGLIAGTGLMTYVTPEGASQGFTSGSPLPAASVTNEEYFVIVESAGGFTPPGGAFTVVTQGDWFLSAANVWQFLNVGYDPPYATTTVPGIVELATDAETQTGTDTTRAITPSNLRTTVVYKSDYNAKGDILSATADNTPSILGVGTDGQVLTADSATSTGLKWETPIPPAFYTLDTITFDGIASSFNLTIGGAPYTPSPPSNIMVFLGGVPQIPGAGYAYTIAGAVITFTAVPPVGTTFYATTVK